MSGVGRPSARKTQKGDAARGFFGGTTSAEKPRQRSRLLASATNQRRDDDDGPVRTAETLCGEHRDKLKLFCFECARPLCVECTYFEDAHEGHHVKPLAMALSLA